MDVLVVIYLIYIFLALYMTTLFILLYLKNKNDLYSYPVPKRVYSVSFIVPAYNEAKTIADTILSILDIDYPVKEIIVINDGSTDNTREIVSRLARKYKKIKLINKKNSGKADSINQGLKIAKGELVAIVDADSYPRKDCLKKMVGFFDDEKVGIATCHISVKNRDKLIGRLQAFEYAIIAWTRKLLDYVDSVYIAPGPLALYRKKALLKAGGFDTKNMTEDIESTWHLLYNGYQARMSLDTTVTTVAPTKFKVWKDQRIRWNMGGIQTAWKYKKAFFKRGMLGKFVMPFFVIAIFLGFLGLAIFIFLLVKRFLLTYSYAQYTMIASTPFLTMEDIFFTPSVLNYYGIVLFLVGLVFTLFGLKVVKESGLRKGNFFNLFIYLLIYMTAYPILLVPAIWRLAFKKFEWGAK